MDNILDSDVSDNALGHTALAVEPVRLEHANTLANRINEFITIGLAHRVQLVIPSVKRHLGALELFFRGRPFNRDGLLLYFTKLNEKAISDDWYNRNISIIGAFLRWSYRNNYIDYPLFHYLPKKRTRLWKEPKIMTEELYRKFIEAFPHRPMTWAVVCGYHTGFRLKDVCYLRWQEVDMERQVITIIPSKTARTGLVVRFPILTNTDLYVWLKRMSENKDDPVFVNPYIRHSYHHNLAFSQDISRAMKQIGFEGSFHSLRATAESRLANSGMNIAIAAKLTGRTDSKALMRYIKPDLSFLANEYSEALGAKEEVKLLPPPEPVRKNTEPVGPNGADCVPAGIGKELPPSWLI